MQLLTKTNLGGEETIKDHKHYELCRRAHCNTSFTPEKRAEMYCTSFDANQAMLKELGARQETIDKSERLFIEWMQAKSRCMSSMITGPARFPVAKAEKANRSEEAKGKAYYDHFDAVKKAIEKEKYYEAHPEARPISNSDEDAMERLKAKLEKMEKERELNNAINKIVRRKPKAECTPEKVEALKALNLSETLITEIFKPGFCGGVGIPAYVNQNLGGNIKRVKERIAELEQVKSVESDSIDLGDGVTVTQDTEAMRVYFEFPGKPSDEVRALLKSNGFRWTPSQGHWGRKLTGNASHSARKVMEQLKSNQAA